MALLLDTGIVYALADVDDDWHERARELITTTREARLVPITVVPEAAYLIRARLGPTAELALVRSLVGAELMVEDVTFEDLERCAKLLEQYPDLGLVDASVVAIAERLRMKSIATTDRRHFGPIRPRHVKAFTLLP